jgi:hypothetical protein
MVLTKAEFVAALQNEVRILMHLTTKVDRAQLDYRPTPKQRSTLEVLQYLTMMGPALVQAAKTGAFDVDGWSAAEKAAAALDYDQVLTALAAHAERYPRLLEGFSDAELREPINPFGMGPGGSRGEFLVNNVLCGCAAYRTQLFLYLKACGRAELGTWNLWVGLDAPPTEQA